MQLVRTLLPLAIVLTAILAARSSTEADSTLRYPQPAEPAAKGALEAEIPVYYPEVRPGYAGWANLFPFGNGDLGVAFNEIKRQENPDWEPISLEFAEMMVVPYMFGPSDADASPHFTSEYVHMKSSDRGRTWTETGRSPVHTRHYCYVGFPDGRLVRIYGTSFMGYLGEDRNWVVVEESTDGGNTWQELSRFLAGYSMNMMKVHRLSDNSIVMCGPIRPSFAASKAKDTRLTIAPGELYPHAPAFFVSRDGGHTWDGPHYVFPGIVAWEFDFVELPNGDLLFINSTIQSGRPVRQIVKRTTTGYVNEPVQAIRRGAPTEPDDWQTCRGFVPETICITPEGLLVGALRDRPYSCSNDLGENWYEINGLPNSNYQPMIHYLPEGRFLNVWHTGSDHHFGEIDMFVGIHSFRVEAKLPKPTKLTLKRQLDPASSQYINVYEAALTSGGEPVADREVELRVLPVWTAEGPGHTLSVRESPEVRKAVTNERGVARFVLSDMDGHRDVHYAYRIAASFTPQPDDDYAPCLGPERMAYAMTPTRNRPVTYPAYMLHGILVITPPVAQRFPELVGIVEKLDKDDPDMPWEWWRETAGSEARARELLDFLVDHHILTWGDDGLYRWYRGVHYGEHVIAGVKVSDLEEYYR